MTVSSQDLLEIVESVWSTTLDTETSEAESGSPADVSGLSCRLEISGAWDGVVVVGCSRDILEDAACHMFQIDLASEQDCQDALSELTNMVGGSVKSFLSEPCSLGLPEVDMSGAMPANDEFGSVAMIECYDSLMCVAVSA